MYRLINDTIPYLGGLVLDTERAHLSSGRWRIRSNIDELVVFVFCNFVAASARFYFDLFIYLFYFKKKPVTSLFVCLDV